MRGILLSLIIFGSLPFIVMRPFLGLLVYSWISLMSPHRLTFGFAYSLPWAMIVGVVFLGSWLFSKESKKPPADPIFFLTVLFTLWMCVTTVFSLAPENAWPHWHRIIKIMVIALVTMIMLTDRKRIDLMIWVIVGSIGFFGVKGGIFTLATGGHYWVLGPEGSMIQENNEMAMATIMVLPLLRYLHLQVTNRYLWWGMLGAMPLMGISILGSQSRGGFLALSAMGGYLLLKSRHKLVGIIAVGVFTVITLSVMPQSWFDRMQSISNYERDGSAQGRINAWKMGTNLALDRPFRGGGFKVYETWRGSKGLIWEKYNPQYYFARAPHSNYFQVLGEHGFPGLFLYLTILALAFFYGGSLIRAGRRRPDLKWASDLGTMCQICLVGYCVGGLVINFAYYDVFWAVAAILIGARRYVKAQLAEKPAPDESVPVAAGAVPESPSFVRRPGTPVAGSGFLRG